MKTEFRQFEGLANPVRIDAPDVVLPLMSPVFGGWPHPETKPAGTPFASLSPVGDGKAWRLAAPRAEKPEAYHKPVNAICDLIVEMSWERLRSRPDLLCLHAAAVAFQGRLVIFPNQRRAGKSLLTATLARHGHAVFTDDFVPLAVDAETGVISGVANGIAPRLRLPLPDNLSPDHNDWIMRHITTQNRQYGYLTQIDLPQSGSEMPVGAMVLLDRDMDLEGPPQLTPVAADEALDAIVRQNFGRQVHAGAILAITKAIATAGPVLRLTYRDMEPAAALLDQTPLLSDLPAVQIATSDQRPTRPAPLDKLRDRTTDVARLEHQFSRIAGYTEAETPEAIYLASETGLAIHKLNPVSAMIWRLLETPLTGDVIVSVLGDVFPDVAQDVLRADVSAALALFLRDGLLAQTGTDAGGPK